MSRGLPKGNALFCPRCRKMVPLSGYASPKRGYCRMCELSYGREYYQRRLGRNVRPCGKYGPPANPDGKQCPTCGQFKPWSDYHKGKHSRSGHAYECKMCAGQRSRVWDSEHREVGRERARRYKLKHPHWVTAYAAKRRATTHKATVPGTEKAVTEFYHWTRNASVIRCYLCGKVVPKGDRHVDHVMPLSLGGAHSVENLAVLHSSCNLQKHDKPPQSVGLLL